MIRQAWIVAVIVTALAAGAAPAVAQAPGAEVRTWSGDTYRLAEASLELLYTILVKKKDEGPEPAETAPTTGAKTPMLFGSASSINRFLDKSPDPLLGNRLSDTITLRRGDAEIRLPLANVGTLAFTRQPVRSPLPPYAATQVFRHSAVAVLTDGSRVEADYVNLGTTFLRGSTGQVRVAIPWQEIEIVRFTR